MHTSFVKSPSENCKTATPISTTAAKPTAINGSGKFADCPAISRTSSSLILVSAIGIDEEMRKFERSVGTENLNGDSWIACEESQENPKELLKYRSIMVKTNFTFIVSTKIG